MCILPDHEIINRMEKGSLSIEEFSPQSITPNGYDLRIAEISVRGSGSTNQGTVSIPPRTMFYVSTIESVGLPSDICAQLWLRTTWIRRGIMSSFGKVDAGFKGTLTLGAFNATDDFIDLPIGERFCQMVLEKLNSFVDSDYSVRSGNYQNQRGVTLQPKNKY